MVRSLLVLFATAIVLAVALAQASDFPDGVAKRYNKKEPSLFWTRQGEEYRLPKSLEPTVYSIRLLPFIEPGNFTVDGYIEIRVNCIEDTNNITMNSKDIEINDMSITVNWKIKQTLCATFKKESPVFMQDPVNFRKFFISITGGRYRDQ